MLSEVAGAWGYCFMIWNIGIFSAFRSLNIAKIVTDSLLYLQVHGGIVK